tara:strand:- start:69 stop:323 length:255 start_codon:yes stop_codon:yes gene_type:complete
MERIAMEVQHTLAQTEALCESNINIHNLKCVHGAQSLMAKLGQSLHLRNKLLGTKNAALVYSCVDDEVWGNGLDFPYQDDQRFI